MGIFSKKAVCEMCGKADAEGCGSVRNHIVQIRGEEPSWLPPSYFALKKSARGGPA